MGLLNINDLERGMELAEDVSNPWGMVLLKAGTIIDEKKLKAFKAWGVTEASIKGEDQDDLDDPALAVIDEQTQERIEQELSYIFQKTDMGNPIVAEIYRLIKKRRLKSKIGE